MIFCIRLGSIKLRIWLRRFSLYLKFVLRFQLKVLDNGLYYSYNLITTMDIR